MKQMQSIFDSLEVSIRLSLVDSARKRTLRPPLDVAFFSLDGGNDQRHQGVHGAHQPFQEELAAVSQQVPPPAGRGPGAHPSGAEGEPYPLNLEASFQEGTTPQTLMTINIFHQNMRAFSSRFKLCGKQDTLGVGLAGLPKFCGLG